MFLYDVNTNNICAHSANKSGTKYPIALERQGCSRDFPTLNFEFQISKNLHLLPEIRNWNHIWCSIYIGDGGLYHDMAVEANLNDPSYES